MANNQSFIDKKGLAYYDSRLKSYLNEKLQPASELKRGTIKTTDLPCYTSNLELKFSGSITVGGYDDTASFSEDLNFLFDLIDSSPYTYGDRIPEEAVPSYIVIINGRVFEQNYMQFSDLSNNNYMAALENSTVFLSRRNDGSGQFRVNGIDENTECSVKIYRKGVESVHQLDSKYIPTASEISNSETGYATGSQVYNHVLSALSGVTGALRLKGVVSNANSIPSRASVEAGDVYIASASFTYNNSDSIENGDMIVFTSTGTSSSWASYKVIQGNLSNVVTGPNSTSNNTVAVFNGTSGKSIKSSGYTIYSLLNRIEAIYAGDTEIEPSDGEGYDGTNVYLAKVAGTGSYNDLTNKPTVKVATGNTLSALPDEIVDFVEIVPPANTYSSNIIVDYTETV